jgi:predicted enzyme related to lactoylglutathione lyase
MKSKLIAINVPASDHTKVSRFYQTLMGMEPARSYTTEVKSLHAPLSNDGHFLFISDRNAEDEQIACLFAVDDLNAAKKELEAAGGKVFVDNIKTPIAPSMRQTYDAANTSGHPTSEHLGVAALVRDPENNVIAIIKLEPHAAGFFNAENLTSYLSHAVKAAHRLVLHEGAKLS